VAVHLCRVDLFYRLEVDLSEVRSYMLGEDGRTITLMMRDGTRHNTLVFIGILYAVYIIVAVRLCSDIRHS
jgi:hypothetical protein